MKNAILLFSMLFLIVSLGFAQNAAYVLKTSGDTLWVKDDADYNGVNTLYSLMNSDSLSPASRVYILHNGGIYSLVNNPVSSGKHKSIVMGETRTSLKLSTGNPPPILQGAVYQGGSSTGGMNVAPSGNLLVANCDVEIGNSAGGEGWGFFNGNASTRLQVDNCIIEHNMWVTIAPASNMDVFFTNDYFVNLDGHTCRRNGGVIDYFGNVDTIFAENCTFVNTQGSLFKTRPTYKTGRVLFNHNDFIDCSGYVFMNSAADIPGYSVTNNIFVNTTVQPYCSVLTGVDVGEVDPDGLPMGIVNLKGDSTFAANGASFYADKNLVYWDPSLSTIPATNNTNKVDGNTAWVSQMIEANSRTLTVIANKTTYPKVNVLGWIENTKPTFKNTDVLFTTQLTILATFSTKTVDTSFTGSLKSWRQASNPEATYYTYADWPIPINLSYTDASLLTAGLGKFPVGDLDWFPTQFASWKAQEATELASISSVLSTGKVTGVATTQQELPQGFKLQQNYPNPFNPSTTISYSIAKAGNVTLKVYNMLGQEVASLVNGYQAANSYNVNFNASNLSSGIYLYELRSGSNVITKSMVLMK
jgi:hypothetical protein